MSIRKKPVRKSAWKPTYLGKPVKGAIDRVELIPWDMGSVIVRLDCSDFTTLCPVTDQPDFGRLIIEYIPDAHLVETKSLKLYLQGFRDRKGFNEKIIAGLVDELYSQIAPKWLRVQGDFHPRGGISVTCSAHRGFIPGNVADDLDRLVL